MTIIMVMMVIMHARGITERKMTGICDLIAEPLSLIADDVVLY